MNDTFLSRIQDPRNREQVAVIVVGYNRLQSIRRLLGSVLKADYPTGNTVPLVISIDCSGDLQLYDYVRNFQWPHGEKYLRIQPRRLGLKEHIFACGDLTSYFRGVILLEDDLYVSPDFYRYACTALEYYGEEPRVSGISLYAHEMNGYVGLPFTPLQNGSDAYAVQAVSSWGECWNARMWFGFRTWLANKGETSIDFGALDIPAPMKGWTQAWSKYYYAYLLADDLFFIFPYVSLTTNFCDAGVHGNMDNTIVQVGLQYGPRKYFFRQFDQLVKYDVFCNNCELAGHLGISPEALCTDFYGDHDVPHKRYRLTPLELPHPKIRSYALNLRPQELNVLREIEGTDLFLYDTSVRLPGAPARYLKPNVYSYHLKGFRRRYLQRVLLNLYREIVVKRVMRRP